ncbi:hypothetical protein B0H14DRAFT_3775143 [Mycena olivaceomarginata]|nr:hypothetical protein B0H14DRAFT_3775143 [Mycena olivaceomarginata]
MPLASRLDFYRGPFMDLPQERIDVILDNVHDDIPSLKSCSLAARTFVTSARKHIFKKVEIVSSSDAFQRFYNLLSSSPHIPPLVEDLRIISVFLETSSANADSSGDYIGMQVSWDEMEQHLQFALASVFSSPRLEAVHLRGLVIGSPY